MTDFGPQVAIVDDKPNEIAFLESFLSENKIGFTTFNADTIEDNRPKNHLESIELIFLDLYYSETFRPYQCAEWIDAIIPDNKQYELVIWSKDSHLTDELINVLKEIGKAPRYHITKQKGDYPDEKGIQRLIQEIKTEIKSTKEIKIDEFYAEIIDFSEEFVILNCLIDSKTGIYQIRKFERTPLIHFKNFNVGTFLIVKITTSTGERLFEFIEQFADLSSLFEQKNIFEKFKNTPLIKD